MKNNLKIGDSVMVPRTGGNYSPGTIVDISGDDAVVEFLVGNTYQGQPSSPNDRDCIAHKKVPRKNLIPVKTEVSGDES